MFRSQHAFLIVVSTVLTFERTFSTYSYREGSPLAHLSCAGRAGRFDMDNRDPREARSDARPDVIHVTSDVSEVVSDVARWTRTDTVPSTHSRAN